MFTTQEYIDKHKLGVSITDPQATRRIHAHLLERGYVKVRRGGKWGWVKKGEVPDYSALEAKLEGIK